MILQSSFIACQVTDRLWIGSAPPIGGVLRSNEFEALVLCACEYQPDPSCYEDLAVLNCPIQDDYERGLSASEFQSVVTATKWVRRHVKDGKRVLVTCRAGRNRSGLVVALTLLALGMNGANAIKLIREARGEIALENPMFVKTILTASQNLRCTQL